MRRDLGGLALLFLMPILLITIMALVQDAPFKDFKETKFNALFVNDDKGQVANFIKEGLLKSNHFVVIDSIKNEPISVNNAKQFVQNGTYPFAIIIPKGVSAEVVNSANIIANQIGKQMGMPNTLPHREARDSNAIQVVFDPVSKPAFRMAIINSIEKFTTKIQSEIVLERISKLNPQSEKDTTFDFEKNLHSVSVKEISTKIENPNMQKMNSVQHNVPAWAIFGMFFMIIIISESIINERNSGSWTRIKLIPGSFTDILIGIHLFYVLLGVLQFFAMLLVGVYLMPLIGLPSLQLTNSFHLLVLIVFCISICATTFGVFIGSVFKTSNQALPAGAMSVVILSAIGGIWVPLEVLPPILKTLSVISPMRWALEGVNDILLRDATFMQLLKPCAILLVGSFIMLFLSWWLEKKRSV